MTEMTPELEMALAKLAAMKHPLVEDLLRAAGFVYEGYRVADVVNAYEKARQRSK